MRKKNLSQIRQNINRRKKMKSKEKITNNKKVYPIYTMNDEERHGFESSPYPPIKKKEKDIFFIKGLLSKSVIAAAVFLAATVTISSDHPLLKQPKTWTNYAMTEEFPFATVNAWYQAKFGAPFAINPSVESEGTSEPTALPVAGKVMETFQENGEGVRIVSDQDTKVTAVKEGTVLFAGNKKDTGKTVIVQHADQSKSIYGQLSNVEVHSYQSIQANETIGMYKPVSTEEAMYFAIEKNRKYMDPIQVIKVDEQS